MAERPQIPARSTPRRAVVVGAGSFGTAVAVLLARGGLRTTLQARTVEQAQRLTEDRENAVYLPGVEFPRGPHGVSDGLTAAGLPPKAKLVALAKGLVPPDGIAPTVMLTTSFGASRV